MSKEIEQSSFVPTGFDNLPSLYFDDRDIGSISEKPDDQLEDQFQEYKKFLSQPDLMPRAKRLGRRILRHVMFEKAWRMHYFDSIPDSVEEMSDE